MGMLEALEKIEPTYLKEKHLGKGFPHAPHGMTKMFIHIGILWKHEFDHAGFVETSLMLDHFRQS